MKKYILDVVLQLQKLWQTLETSQKITILLLSVIIFISLFFVGMWGAKPDYDVLFSNLSSQDAAEIIGKLNEAKVPYEIGEGGGTISVPKKHVYEMRIQMASQGLPKGSGVGFEVFDSFKLGATDFTQKLNYQRALQTELERTITKIAQIRQARVHIAIPDEQIFIDEKQETTASVVLDLLGSAGLTPQQIKGIVHLVASSVKGLKPQNITLIDSNGNLLYSAAESDMGDVGGFSTNRLEAQSAFERAMERRVQSMLVSVIGPNKSVVRVNASLDFNQEREEAEIYEPAEEPIPRSERVVEETFSGEGTQGAGTIPGTAANIPGIGDETNANSSKYSRLEEVRNYEVTKKIKHAIKAPGSINRISVAVLLDRQINEEQTEAITQAVRAAVGIDEARGDSLVIRNIDFDKTAFEKDMAEMKRAGRTAILTSVLKYAGVGLFALVFFLFLFNAIRKVPVTSTSLVASPNLRDEEFDEKVRMREEEIEAELARMDKLAMPTAESQKRLVMQRQIERIAKKDTEGFVKLLRSWLAED